MLEALFGKKEVEETDQSDTQGSSSGGSVQSAHAETVSKHVNGAASGVKRGRGRPRKDGSTAAGGMGQASSGISPTPPQANIPTIDAELVKEITTDAYKIVHEWKTGKIGRAVYKASEDKGLANEMMAEVMPNLRKCEMFGKLSAAVWCKYPMLAAYAPEVALGFIIITDITLTLKTFKKIEEIVALNKKSPERPAENITPQPKENAAMTPAEASAA